MLAPRAPRRAPGFRPSTMCAEATWGSARMHASILGIIPPDADASADEGSRLLRRHARDEPPRRIHDARHIRQKHQVLCHERGGDGAGRGVAVYVQNCWLPAFVERLDGQGSDHWDVAGLCRLLNDIRAHLDHISDQAQLLAHDLGLKQAAVDAAESEGPAPLGLNGGHQLLVDQPGQHRGNHFESRLVRHAQTAYESGERVGALHPLADDVAPAVDHHGDGAAALQADQVIQRGVAAAKGAAANLDHHRPSRWRLARDWTQVPQVDWLRH